jgi:large subunit ribosomal protein L21
MPGSFAPAARTHGDADGDRVPRRDERPTEVFVYAIIRDGGHQYRVEPNRSILIERLGLKAGDKVRFGEVLFVNGKVGSPTVPGAAVEAVVVGEEKAKKIFVVKYQRRKNYRRRFGHRQHLTRVKIESIVG